MHYSSALTGETAEEDMAGGKSKREKPRKDIWGGSSSENTIFHFIPLQYARFHVRKCRSAKLKMAFVLMRVVICPLPKTNYFPLSASQS